MIAPRLLRVLVGPSGLPGRQWDESLQIEIEIEQSKTRAPDSASVRLFNLSRASLAFLETTPDLVVQVVAGQRFPALLYRGDLRRRGVTTTVEPPNQITTLDCGTGRTAFVEARVSLSYPPGVSSTLILADLALQLGAAGAVVGYVDPTLAPVTYASGWAFEGYARDALTEVVDDLGADWTDSPTGLQIVARGSTVPGQAVVVSAETGMRKAPTRTDRGVAVETTLTPEIRPGRLVSVVSQRDPSSTGFYRVTKSTHRADSRGVLWSTQFEAKPL